jgi:hypothetical protein
LAIARSALQPFNSLAESVQQDPVLPHIANRNREGSSTYRENCGHEPRLGDRHSDQTGDKQDT